MCQTSLIIRIISLTMMIPFEIGCTMVCVLLIHSAIWTRKKSAAAPARNADQRGQDWFNWGDRERNSETQFRNYTRLTSPRNLLLCHNMSGLAMADRHFCGLFMQECTREFQLIEGTRVPLLSYMSYILPCCGATCATNT
jgi:hypothetical protein